MSRSYCSYNEDWQRRKSVLIRSLFHDIPILSPVAEESYDSYQYAPTREVCTSPPRPHSPLPPLIIERVPITNKHDEPEEYYKKLHNKIKKIYLKLFIENRNLNSVDYESDYNDSSVIDDNVIDSGPNKNLDLNFLQRISQVKGDFVPMIQDGETSERSNSTNGYETDLDSIDTEVVDIVNYTAPNEERSMRSDKEESSTDSRRIIDDQEMTTSEETNEIEEEQSYAEELLIKSPGKRKIADETSITEPSKRVRKQQEDSSEKQVSNPNDTERELSESKESNQTEDEQSYHEEMSSNDNNDELGINTKIGATDDLQFNQGSTADDQELTEIEVSSTTDNETQSNDNIGIELHLNEKVWKSRDCKNTVCEDSSNVETMEKDDETSHSSEDEDFRQITTEALVHIDGSQDTEERESRVYEDSVRSVILPTRFRRLMISCNVDVDEGIEVLPVLEESAGPKFIPTFDTDESETPGEDIDEMETPQPDATEEVIDEVRATEQGSEERRTRQPDIAAKEIERETVQDNVTDKEIEEMRSHPPDLSQGTIPMSHRSKSVSTSDHIPFPQEPTVMMSSSQDGVDRDHSEFKISNDVNEILHSIFNESGNKDGISNSGRKRKLFVDKSVQAVQGSRVSWNDVRADFFVGTPKIFRLCTCNDHICH